MNWLSKIVTMSLMHKTYLTLVYILHQCSKSCVVIGSWDNIKFLPDARLVRRDIISSAGKLLKLLFKRDELGPVLCSSINQRCLRVANYGVEWEVGYGFRLWVGWRVARSSLLLCSHCMEPVPSLVILTPFLIKQGSASTGSCLSTTLFYSNCSEMS